MLASALVANRGGRGVAIECRIYADDPARNVLPSRGLIKALVLPDRPGIRLECGVAIGVEVSVHYDPLLAEVDAVTTVIPFHGRAMARAAFRAGELHTQLVEQGAFNA